MRGLAYYTGVVFEAFDRAGKFRALAGGGRYDKLIAQLSDDAVSLPAVGFAMGDVVLGELIAATPAARRTSREQQIARRQKHRCLPRRGERRTAAGRARPDANVARQKYRVDFAITPAKVGKQFQTAEQLGATRRCFIRRRMATGDDQNTGHRQTSFDTSR